MYVVVDHGGGYTTTYAHLSDVYVYVGQEVAQGESLGAVGSTCLLYTSPSPRDA